MATYHYKRNGICPRCQSSAVMEEDGNASGDWITGTCSNEHCGFSEQETMETADDLCDRWSYVPVSPDEPGVAKRIEALHASAEALIEHLRDSGVSVDKKLLVDLKHKISDTHFLTAEADQRLIDKARKIYDHANPSIDVQIDDGAVMDNSCMSGVFVQAWVLVSR